MLGSSSDTQSAGFSVGTSDVQGSLFTGVAVTIGSTLGSGIGYMAWWGLSQLHPPVGEEEGLLSAGSGVLTVLFTVLTDLFIRWVYGPRVGE